MNSKVLSFGVLFLILLITIIYAAEIKLPEKEFIVLNFKLDIGFKNVHMTTEKIIDVDYKRIGVVKGDSITFIAKTKPQQNLPKEQYNWSGEQPGQGQTISIIFGKLLGKRTETLNCKGAIKTATISVVEVPPPNEVDFRNSNWHVALAALQFYIQASDWAGYYDKDLGGGGWNGRADAARHAYFNVKMTISLSEAIAAAASTSHERTNLEENAAHNEIVMDLENNSGGRKIGTELILKGTTYESAIKDAIIDALDKGELTILDALGELNANEVGLLMPSNKK